MTYTPEVDGLRSYYDAVAAIRDRHRSLVFATIPRLRNARGRRRLSQIKFAERLGVSRRTLQEWELGHNIPPADLFRRWRHLLDC